jgi:hypothetical protein
LHALISESFASGRLLERAALSTTTVANEDAAYASSSPRAGKSYAADLQSDYKQALDLYDSACKPPITIKRGKVYIISNGYNFPPLF